MSGSCLEKLAFCSWHQTYVCVHPSPLLVTLLCGELSTYQLYVKAAQLQIQMMLRLL